MRIVVLEREVLIFEVEDALVDNDSSVYVTPLPLVVTSTALAKPAAVSVNNNKIVDFFISLYFLKV